MKVQIVPYADCYVKSIIVVCCICLYNVGGSGLFKEVWCSPNACFDTGKEQGQRRSSQIGMLF